MDPMALVTMAGALLCASTSSAYYGDGRDCPDTSLEEWLAGVDALLSLCDADKDALGVNPFFDL